MGQDGSRVFVNNTEILEGLNAAEQRAGNARFPKDFGAKEILGLAKELEKIKYDHVKSVSLNLQSHGAEQLGLWIARNKSIKALEVTSSFSSTLLNDDLEKICKGLVENDTLESFSIFALTANEKHVPTLARMIRGNKGLRELVYSRTVMVAPKGEAEDVFAAVIEEGRIQKFTCSYCMLASPHFAQLFGALKHNKNLRQLAMEQNNLMGQGARLLGEWLHDDAVLEELDITDCSLTEADVGPVADALKHNKALRVLKIGNNKIQEQGGLLLAEALRENKTLNRLDAPSCSLGTAGVDCIAEALVHNTVLKELDLRYNTSFSSQSLANLLAINSTITKIDLSANMIGNQIAVDMAEVLQKQNSTLRDLRLSYCGIEDDGMQRLADMLRLNTGLRVLHVESDRTRASRLVVEALAGQKWLQQLHIFEDELAKDAIIAIAKKNGALVQINNFVRRFCHRNVVMHDKARQAVQALRVLRMRKGESMLHKVAKEVVKMIGIALWDTRTEIAAWAPK